MSRLKLPYETTSMGERALAQSQRLLQSFGCQQFAHALDYENRIVLVSFKHRDRIVKLEASMKGYAAMWLKAHPYTSRHMRKTTREDYEARAYVVAENAVYSMLRDWIRGQITAIETGMLTFESAFLAQIVLPSGRTAMQHLYNEKLLGTGE